MAGNTDDSRANLLFLSFLIFLQRATALLTLALIAIVESGWTSSLPENRNDDPGIFRGFSTPQRIPRKRPPA